MKFKNRQEFLVALTVAVAVLAAVVNFIMPPVQGWWSARNLEIKDLREKVANGNKMIKWEKSTRDRWNDMQSNSLPATASDAEQKFLKQVDGWAHQSGAEITSVMPQWKSESTNYMTLDCRVEADGDLNALSQFIYNLERGPMPLRLDTVELSSHDNNGQVMTLGLEIDGLALLNKDKK
jgi:hypothetical protein